MQIRTSPKEEKIKFTRENFLEIQKKTEKFSPTRKINCDEPDECQFSWHDLQKDTVISKKLFGGRGSVMVWRGPA